MPSIMLDLETLSTESNAYILSIGAVEFDVKSGRLGRSFYKLINGWLWQKGFHINPETVLWWLGQSQESRRLITDSNRERLPAALVQFGNFVEECGGDSCEVWGNGAAFDNVILRNAYGVVERVAPWKFYNDRCFRTFKNLYSPSIPDAPTSAEQVASWGTDLASDLPAGIFTAHSALGDAISQARAMLSVYGHVLS